mgnify:CR=1 FL=1
MMTKWASVVQRGTVNDCSAVLIVEFEVWDIDSNLVVYVLCNLP